MAINNIEQVKWIVHKILPAVYDEALSYYEVLCKVIAKLNEVIANEDAQNEMLVGFDERLSDVEEAVSEIESDIRGEITDVLKTYNGYANGKFLGVSGDEIKWVNMPTVITSYDSLTDKPQINGVTLAGNKTSAQLNIKQIPAGGVVGQVLKKLSDNDYDVAWGSSGGGGGGGTTDYTDLDNKPQINGVTLAGNKSTADLSLGDMKKADYDSDSAVDDAGGIAAYVGSAISTGTSGLMAEADYDAYEVVKDAGGIVPYVESKVVASVVQNFPEDSDFDVVMENADDGEVASTVIMGKTVSVNQLLGNSFITNATWTASNASETHTGNILKMTASAQNGYVTTLLSSILKNVGVYLISAMVKLNTATNQVRMASWASGVGETSVNTEATTNKQQLILIKNITVAQSGNLTFADNRESGWDEVDIDSVWITNLTLRGFTSSEYADVTSLKAAWLKKYGTPIPQYVPHNAGSLANVNGMYRLRGRNIWDEEWELGDFLDNGTEYADNNRIRSKNYNGINGGSTIYRKSPNNLTLYFYDTNKQFVSKSSAGMNNTVIVPDEAKYFRFSVATAYGTTYKKDICINLSDASFNGTYEPYYDGGEIDCSDAPLNGVGTAQDEKDFATGERTTRCGMVDMGTLNWSYTTISGNNAFYAAISDAIGGTNKTNLICARYTAAASVADKNIWLNNKSVYVIDNAYSDAAAFTTAVTGLYLCYELATPTTTTETPQPVSTQYGYNVLEPISGDVQSSDVNTTYLHLLGGLFARKADLVNGKVPNSQLPDFGEANVINFDSIVSGTTTIPADDRTKLSDMTKPCEIHIGTAVYHRATPFRFYWEQKGTVLNVVKILEINSSTYIITETTMFASYATTATNKGIPETGTNGVWKLVANKTVASDASNTGFTYTELLGGNYDEYMIVVKGKAKGNVSILNTNSGGTSLSNTITYREGASTSISNNQSAIPATNGNYFEATLTLKNYISFGSGNGGYFALDGNACDGDSTTQSTYFIQCAWKIAYAGTYAIGFNNLAKDSEIRLYGRNTGDYVFPNPL